MGPFMLIPPFACTGGGGSPCPSCGGPTSCGGPLANSVCGRFFVAFGLLDANKRSAKHKCTLRHKPILLTTPYNNCPSSQRTRPHNCTSVLTSMSSMPLAFRIFLISIGHSDRSVAQILPIHSLHNVNHRNYMYLSNV